MIASAYYEIRRINEYASLVNFEETEEIQKEIFISKLTSKDDETDKNLGKKAALAVIQIIYAREQKI